MSAAGPPPPHVAYTSIIIPPPAGRAAKKAACIPKFCPCTISRVSAPCRLPARFLECPWSSRLGITYTIIRAVPLFTV